MKTLRVYFLAAFGLIAANACAAPTVTLISHSTFTVQQATISVPMGRIDTLYTNTVISSTANINIANSWINVKNPPYNAQGNGTTNDRAAIVAAITQASANGGSTVFFPPGKYMIGNMIIVPERVTIQGAGMSSSTIAALTGTFPIDTALIQLSKLDGSLYPTANPGEPITFRDIRLDCTGQPTPSGNGTAQGLAVFNIRNFSAERVWVEASQGYGIHTAADDGTYGLLNPTIKFCVLKNNGRYGGQDTIGGANTDGSMYLFNTFDAPNGTSIDNVHVTNALWMGNRTINTSSTTHNGQIWSDYGMVNSQILDNYIENGSIHVYGNLAGVFTGPPSNILIAGNQINNAGSSGIFASPANQSAGVNFTTHGIRIMNNIVNGCVDTCVSIQDATGTIISGNILKNWSVGGGTHYAIDFLGGPNTALGVHRTITSNNTGGGGPAGVWYHESTAGGAADNNNNFVGSNQFPGYTMTLSAVTPLTNTFNVENGTFTINETLTISHTDTYTVPLTDYSGTTSITGFSSFSTKALQYKKVGKTVTVYFYLVGTGNNIATTVSLPFTMNANVPDLLNTYYAIDNGGSPVAGTWIMFANNATVTLYPTVAGGNWTASGARTLSGTIVYEAN